MSTDLQIMVNNLCEFYDFTDEVVLSVGAGGGQLYEYAFSTWHVIAVDNDINGIERLKESLLKEGILDTFTLVHSDFYDFKAEGDLLMFDYCLHEIPDPEKAIHHALTMSSRILINDHWPDSEWAYITNEDVKVKRCWQAIEKFRIRKIQRYDTSQFFYDYEGLFQKVKNQGNNSIERIKKYKGKKDFKIPMSYVFVLIERTDDEILD